MSRSCDNNKPELIAIYRLEFYRKKDDWKLKKEAQEETNKKKTPVATLNETYNIDVDCPDYIFNEAFLNSEPDKLIKDTAPEINVIHSSKSTKSINRRKIKSKPVIINNSKVQSKYPMAWEVQKELETENWDDQADMCQMYPTSSKEPPKQNRIMKTWSNVKEKAGLDDIQFPNEIRPPQSWIDLKERETNMLAWLNQTPIKFGQTEHVPEVPINLQNIGLPTQATGDQWQGYGGKKWQDSRSTKVDRTPNWLKNLILNDEINNAPSPDYYVETSSGDYFAKPDYESEVVDPRGSENFSFFESKTLQSPEIYNNWLTETDFTVQEWVQYVAESLEPPPLYEEHQIQQAELECSMDSYCAFACEAHLAPHSSEIDIELNEPEEDYPLCYLTNRQLAERMTRCTHAIAAAVKEVARRRGQQVFEPNTFAVAPNTMYLSCDEYPTRDIGLSPPKEPFSGKYIAHNDCFVAGSYLNNGDEYIRHEGRNIIKIEMGRPYRL